MTASVPGPGQEEYADAAGVTTPVAEATAEWMANNPSPAGIPQDPPRNPYENVVAPPDPAPEGDREWAERFLDAWSKPYFGDDRRDAVGCVMRAAERAGAKATNPPAGETVTEALAEAWDEGYVAGNAFGYEWSQDTYEGPSEDPTVNPYRQPADPEEGR